MEVDDETEVEDPNREFNLRKRYEVAIAPNDITMTKATVTDLEVLG